MLRLAGIEPRGFVAPAYAYTRRCARRSRRVRLVGGAGALHRANRSSTTAPALCLGTSTALKRWTSPTVVRVGARCSGERCASSCTPPTSTTRAASGRVEKVLRGGRGRVAVTYDDLAGV